MNPHVRSNKEFIEIDVSVHLDASGSEVFFQVEALAPDDIPNLFGKYGHSTPEVTAGYAGKEGDMRTVTTFFLCSCKNSKNREKTCRLFTMQFI